MKILFVEDNDGFARDLEPVLADVMGVESVLRVSNKEDASIALTTNQIDLVILDLSIPPYRDTDITDPEHGQALFHEAKDLLPGTPIFILTGSEVQKFSRGLARYGNQIPLWGGVSELETVSFFLKEEVDELLKRLTVFAAAFRKMASVTINTRGKDLGLSTVQRQMLKTFTNAADGVACDVTRLSGGLSDAKVVKVEAMDRNRKPQVLCAGKLGPKHLIESELAAYHRHTKRLGVGAYPNLYYSISTGVGQNGAIFYTLTDSDTASFFDRLNEKPHQSADTVQRVRNGLDRWSQAANADLVTIASIRQRLLSDEDAHLLEKKFNLSSLRSVEELEIQASQSCIHGDLHCGNVLVSSDGHAILIDFGDVDHGFTALDPIALELSLIFHPEAIKLGFHDRLVKNLQSWNNVESFADDEPLTPMVIACRNWAYDVGGGDQAVLASAYAYAMRQLKYETVDPKVTLGFLELLVELIGSN